MVSKMIVDAITMMAYRELYQVKLLSKHTDAD